MTRLLCLLIAVSMHVIVAAASAAPRLPTLDAWLAQDLAPYVREQLGDHPRFRGESIRFVVFDNNVPQALSNALALRVRDRLRDAVADVPGIRLAWQAGEATYLQHAGFTAIDCTRSDVHYLVGIEMRLLERGFLSVELLAVDLEEHAQVPGFGKSWQGQISSRQYREFRRGEADPAFRGARDVPYDESQTDLLAAHLAHELGCSLFRQTEGEYVIAGAGAAAGEPAVKMVELVSNNLARYSALQFSSSDEEANAIITGKAHRIDEDLYQYWVTVQPRETGGELHALSASAYLHLPERFASAGLITGSPEPALRSTSGFLGSLQIVELERSRECRVPALSSARRQFERTYADTGDCYALAVRAADDAVVFFLHHQLNNGLVRLANASCMPSTDAKVAKSRQQVRFALPQDLLASADWSGGADWQLYPDRDTFYAVATTDGRAARELSAQIRKLPYRCGASVRPGLEGAGLKQWLDDFERSIEKWGAEIHWQGIRVRNVY